MNKKTISVALTALLLASAATASAQDGGNTGQYDPNAASQLPEGYDSSAPDARYDGNAANQLPEGVDPNGANQSTSLSGEMQGMVDEIMGQQQGQMLSGDEGSACEAILCLSTGGPPSECAASLRKYFSINLSKPWKTIQARINFLKLCPTSDDTPQMGTLVELRRGLAEPEPAHLDRHRRRIRDQQPDAFVLRSVLRPRVHRRRKHPAALRRQVCRPDLSGFGRQHDL